ncbi:MAG TPA: NAD(P)-dependent oxidoreductase [Phycisphaerae bacterium]|nr:NAD(P)-dependent oxidoreductase [Phycisphaerae bacterium]
MRQSLSPVIHPDAAPRDNRAADSPLEARPGPSRSFVTLAIAADELPIVVVGGGVVGGRKALSLARQGGRVRIISPEIADRLRPLVDRGRIEWIRDCYRPEHLDGARIVVAATSDPAVNAAVARDARRRGLLLCNSSSAEDSGVFFPAMHTRGPATIAVHTRGRSPRYAKRLLDHIVALLAERPLETAEDSS